VFICGYSFFARLFLDSPMLRTGFLLAAPLLLILTGPVSAAKYTVKVEDAPPPAEVGNRVRSLLEVKGLSVYDDAGNLLLTVWPRKALESKATAEQVKSGLTYRELEESDVVGAVKFPKLWTDYRKQKIKAGVYTMRVGWQPMDGDHMGTAPFNEFCLLSPAAKDPSGDKMPAKALHELSAGSVGSSHPGVMLLFPNPKPADEPAVESKPNNIWLLNFKRPVTAAGQKASLGFSLVVIGQTMSE
jgi:hypothetical protein